MSHWSDPKVMIGAAILRHFIPGLIILAYTIFGIARGGQAGWFFALFSLPLAGFFIVSGWMIVRAALKE